EHPYYREQLLHYQENNGPALAPPPSPRGSVRRTGAFYLALRIDRTRQYGRLGNSLTTGPHALGTNPRRSNRLPPLLLRNRPGQGIPAHEPRRGRWLAAEPTGQPPSENADEGPA